MLQNSIPGVTGELMCSHLAASRDGGYKSVKGEPNKANQRVKLD